MSNVTVKVGSTYKLSNDKKLGDYAGNTVYVETGPRGAGRSEQYRVSYGLGKYDVDWIDTWMFYGAVEVEEQPSLMYKKHKISEQFGQQLKRAAVVVGRFNPPHRGHYAVIDKVKKYIRNNQNLNLDPVPIVVVVEGKETSKDKHRNPLTGEERIRFMTGSGNANGVKFLIAESAFKAFEAVRKAGYEPIAIAAGSDRADKYLEMLDKYFKTPDQKEIDHYVINLDRDQEASEFGDLDTSDKNERLDSLLQYVDEDFPVHMISASLARHAVMKGELQKFAILTGLSDKMPIAKKLFDKIKMAIGT